MPLELKLLIRGKEESGDKTLALMFLLLGNLLFYDFLTENLSNSIEVKFLLLMFDNSNSPAIFNFDCNVVWELKKEWK